MRTLGKVDLGVYARAFVLLVRNPQIVLGPLAASLILVLLFLLMPGEGDGFVSMVNSGIAGLVSQLVSSFGLAVAIIVADGAWRRGRAPFDAAWDDARRRAGDILIAAIGFSFVLYVAGLVGSILPVVGSLVLMLVALFFFVYTLPAAAIGGIPGGASLQISLERARANPLPTLLVTALYVVAFFFAPALIASALAPAIVKVSAIAPNVVPAIVSAVIRAVVSSYLALVLAKTYADISFGRRW